MKRMGREETMTRKTPPMLSKSRFLAGLQCPLRLWFQCYNRELATPVSPSQQAIFDMGKEVGRLATRLYPGGVLIEEDHLHHREAVESTRAAMADPDVPAIYEAGFVHDSVRVRVDVLQRLPGGKWNLIEVKSTTSAKAINKPDDWILALVEVPAVDTSAAPAQSAEATGLYATGHGCAVRYVRQPFEREPDWAATSVTYDWIKLISRGDVIA